MSQDEIELAGTAVVMELPDPVKQAVQKLRERFDPFLADNIPVEITIAGSSGMGTIAPGQNGAFILDELQKVASKMKAFRACLGKVICFPGTPIHVFEVLPLEPFNQLYRLLTASPIIFTQSSHPFFPHCSLHIWGEVGAFQRKEMMRQTVPGDFWLDSFALYQLVQGKTAVLVKRFNLTK